MNLLFYLMCLLLCSCGPSNHELREWIQDKEHIKVLATTAMIADLVKEVGGDEVHVLVLIKGDLDPHSYQLVKGDDEKLLQADVVFANGLSLEHGASLAQHLNRNPKVFFLGDVLLKTRPNPLLSYKGQIDPHIWMDISLFAKTVPLIVEALTSQRPAKAAYFQERGKILADKLEKSHQQVRAILAKVPKEKRYLVTSHDAFNYFARAYLAEEDERASGSWTVRFQAPEGLAPEAQLSSKNIYDILEHILKYRIRIIFPESNVSSDSLKKIQNAALEKGLELRLGNPYLYGDAMGPPGSDGDTYTKMIEHNARTIAQDLNE